MFSIVIFWTVLWSTELVFLSVVLWFDIVICTSGPPYSADIKPDSTAHTTECGKQHCRHSVIPVPVWSALSLFTQLLMQVQHNKTPPFLRGLNFFHLLHQVSLLRIKKSPRRQRKHILFYSPASAFPFQLLIKSRLGQCWVFSNRHGYRRAHSCSVHRQIWFIYTIHSMFGLDLQLKTSVKRATAPQHTQHTPQATEVHSFQTVNS